MLPFVGPILGLLLPLSLHVPILTSSPYSAQHAHWSTAHHSPAATHLSSRVPARSLYRLLSSRSSSTSACKQHGSRLSTACTLSLSPTHSMLPVRCCTVLITHSTLPASLAQSISRVRLSPLHRSSLPSPRIAPSTSRNMASFLRGICQPPHPPPQPTIHTSLQHLHPLYLSAHTPPICLPVFCLYSLQPIFHSIHQHCYHHRVLCPSRRTAPV